MKEVRNIKDLTADLLDTYNQVCRDEMSLKKANTKCNVAGKLMQALRLQMELNKGDQ